MAENQVEKLHYWVGRDGKRERVRGAEGERRGKGKQGQPAPYFFPFWEKFPFWELSVATYNPINFIYQPINRIYQQYNHCIYNGWLMSTNLVEIKTIQCLPT